MRTLLLSISLLLTLQASDCATAGSVQDSAVTQAKREADAESARPTPTPVVMRDVYRGSYPVAEYAPEPKLPKRPGVEGGQR